MQGTKSDSLASRTRNKTLPGSRRELDPEESAASSDCYLPIDFYDLAQLAPSGGDWNRWDEDIANREAIRRRYGFVYPTNRTLEVIVEFVGDATILEIGAGYGLWAKLLQARGVNVIATDSEPGKAWDRDRTHVGTYTTVEKLGARQAVRMHPECDVLMTIWPPMSNMANRALTAFTGSKVIYIGEWEDGCTADRAFFHTLKYYFTVKSVGFPQYLGLHDALYLCERKQR